MDLCNLPTNETRLLCMRRVNKFQTEGVCFGLVVSFAGASAVASAATSAVAAEGGLARGNRCFLFSSVPFRAVQVDIYADIYN